jgi:hypothetical protein
MTMALQAPALPRPEFKLRLLVVAAALALFASAAFAIGRAPTASADGLYQPSDSWYYPYGWPYYGPYGYPFSYPSYSIPVYPTYPYAYPSYSYWCGNNPSYYSYPSAFTCPVSPLNSIVVSYPWWWWGGYPYVIP